MPDPSLITPLGWQLIGDLPPIFREDRDVQAVMHAKARELERLEGSIETVRSQLFPTKADVLLGAYESILGLTIAPAGQSIAQRRATVVAFLRKQTAESTGADWEATVTKLIGPGWSYVEHDPDDPADSPAAYTVRITLPGSSTAGMAQLTATLVRQITPANMHIDVIYGGGFILDVSPLDLGSFL